MILQATQQTSTFIEVYRLAVAIGIPVMILVGTWIAAMLTGIKIKLNRLTVEVSWSKGNCQATHEAIDLFESETKARLDEHSKQITQNREDILILKKV